MENTERIWRVFTFAGWWLVLLGVALTVLFLVSAISSNFAALALSVVGLIIAIIGETILSQHQDKQHRFIWEGLTMGGIFCLAAGLFWIAYLYAVARSTGAPRPDSHRNRSGVRGRDQAEIRC